MNTLQQQIEAFLSESAVGVVGASRNKSKYGYLVFNALRDAGYTVVPVNPNASEIDGIPTVPNVSHLPVAITAIVTITPPQITEPTIELALTGNIKHIWMQPGSETQRSIVHAQQAGISVIAGGPCILVALAARRNS